MAQAILLRGGAGGVTSDDVTASKAQVLQGYKTVTADSDDEVIEGSFPVTSDADARQEFWYYNDHSKDSYVTRIPESAYVKYYNSDRSQSWEPWIRIPRQLIKNAINYHPELTINTVTTLTEQGQIPDRGDGAVISYLQGREDWANRIWVLFKNGWYHRNPWDDGQGHIHEAFVYVTYEQLKNLFGIDGSKMLQGYGIAGVQGTITPRPNASMTTEIVNAHWTTPKKFGFRFPQGYYPNAGNYAPIVEVNYQDLANAIGVRADKMLNDTNILGTQGQIKIINTQDGNYRVNKSAAFGIDGWSDVHNPVFWIDFPHGNGFYCRNDNHPHVCIDAVNLGTAGADSVLSGQTATSVNGVKFEGTIQRWICNTGDVISAVNNEGFVWDDVYAGRGRGIVMKILNVRFIQVANYAFLPSPNLYPQNVVKDININGVTGTRDFVDHVTEYTVTASLSIDMTNREHVISLGNAYSGSQTVFFAVYLVGEDVDYGFVRRDMGNGRYLIGRIPVSKNDSNFIGTYVRNVPIQIEITRDNAGNISLVHHGPNQVLGVTNIMVTIYAHSSTSFSF